MNIRKENVNDVIRRRDVPNISIVLGQKASLLFTDEFKKTPLIAAVEDGNLKLVKSLLVLKVPINQSDNFQWTALHHACFHGNAEISKMLLEHGADANAVSVSKMTPLMCAVISNSGDIVNALLNHNADVTALDASGKSVKTLALEFASEEIRRNIGNVLSNSKRSKGENVSKPKLKTTVGVSRNPPEAKSKNAEISKTKTKLDKMDIVTQTGTRNDIKNVSRDTVRAYYNALYGQLNKMDKSVTSVLSTSTENVSSYKTSGRIESDAVLDEQYRMRFVHPIVSKLENRRNVVVKKVKKVKKKLKRKK
ncbi:hypothetical protein ACOME3_003396 [Neoechinorhynchus agilis]